MHGNQIQYNKFHVKLEEPTQSLINLQLHSIRRDVVASVVFW
jgi:hypothetical protein